MENAIHCTPVECIKLRRRHTPEELLWAATVAGMYCCRPKNKDNERCLYEFIADVFAAGRISGVREERKKRAAKR